MGDFIARCRALCKESPYFSAKALIGFICFLLFSLELGVALGQGLAMQARWQENRKKINLHDLVRADDYANLKNILTSVPMNVDREDADGRTPLHLAAFYGRTEIATLLIEQGADINRQINSQMQGTPLICAVANNHADVVRLLLEKGAAVNAAGASGITPLHIAAVQGRLELIGLLLQYRADPNALAQGGFTPLDFAKKTRQLAAVKLLEQYTHP